MFYVPFHEYFLEIAEKETRFITSIDNPELPDGTYALVESYCDEPHCDCRRVFLNVVSEEGETLAVIAYGWEGKKFYARWMGSNDPDTIRVLKGPCFNPASRQSKYAPVFMKIVKLVLKDKRYIRRLKRHYRMFKDKINKDAKENRD